VLRDPFRPPAGENADDVPDPYRPQETWRVFAGYITRHSDDGIRCWADPEFDLEEWLVSLLQAVGACVPTEMARARSRHRATCSATVQARGPHA
jgi:hypothetical protein